MSSRSNMQKAASVGIVMLPNSLQVFTRKLGTCRGADGLGSQMGKRLEAQTPSQRKKLDSYNDKHLDLGNAHKSAQITTGRSPTPNQHGLDSPDGLAHSAS
jgi:hypothetical protein